MNVQERIKAFRDTRAQKAARLAELLELSGKEGQTLDSAQSEEFETIKAEVETLDKHIEREEVAEKLLLKSARATPGAASATEDDPIVAARKARDTRDDGVIAVAKKAEAGIGFARFVKFMVLARGNAGDAYSMAREVYPNETPLLNSLKLFQGKGRHSSFLESVGFLEKTAVAGAVSTTSTFAGALIQYQDLAQDFINYLRPRTILGRLPNLRNVPFKVRVKRQTGGATASWVGEGKAKPLSNAAFDTVTLDFTKLAAISVVSDEVARLSIPSAEALVRDDLANAVIQTMDSDFIDPANSGSANVKPASITNGVSAYTATGTNTQAGIATDIQNLFAPLIAANIDPAECAWIMTPTTALGLSLLQNSLGQQVFPGISMAGGTFQGLPVVVANAAGLVGASDGSHIVVLVHTPSILVADDGQVAVDVSREASLEMSDSPASQSANGTGASMVSMFQTNSLAVRAERWVNWTKGRTQAVQYAQTVHWGGFPA